MAITGKVDFNTINIRSDKMQNFIMIAVAIQQENIPNFVYG